MEVQLSAVGLAMIPIVMALVSVAKLYVDSRYAPLISLALGIAGALLIPSVSLFGSALLGGIVIGLSASGAYSGAKATFA